MTIEVNPREVLLHAEEFRRASITLEGNNWRPEARDPNVVVPLAVCSAFACELYFKFLILVRTGALPKKRTHNLAELFRLIPDDVQRRIRTRWENPTASQAAMREDLNRLGGANAQDFDAVLADSARAFERLRYSYEHKEGELGWIGGDIGECARRVIWDLYPTEYADVRLPLPPTAMNASEPTASIRSKTDPLHKAWTAIEYRPVGPKR